MSARVEGLLEEHNHSIEFGLEQEIIILYGPNGVGKTHMLELICHTLQGEWALLKNMPFDSAEFRFDDDSIIKLSFDKPNLDRPRYPTLGRTGRRARNDEPQLKVELIRPGFSESCFPPSIDLDQISPMMIKRALSDLGIRNGERDNYPTYSLRSIVADLSSSEVRAIHNYLARKETEDSAIGGQMLPEWIDSFFDDSSATLIETQRLLGQLRGRSNSGESNTPRMLAIQEVSQSVQLLMDAALASNSRISQQLDRTFPERVLNSNSEIDYTAEGIRDKHTKQLAVRERLAEYHLASDDSARVELPNRELEKWEMSFLGLYLEDSEKKLETFKDLLLKLDLFINTINKRFSKKRIYFSDDRSLELENSIGRKLQVADLSSGEQHEIILLKYLLFDASPNSLVLIDEPEISLHVAWQKAFLDDLQEISKISKLRFIIATHSPQIINNSWELTQSLGGAH